MAQVYIEQISRTNKVGKSGKAFVSVGIKCNGKWMNGFGGKWNQDWKQGDTVEVEVVQQGQYTNFEQIDPVKVLTKRVEDLENRIVQLEMGGRPQAARPVAPPAQRQVPAAVRDFNRQANGPGSAYPQYDERNPPPMSDDDLPPFDQEPY